MNVCNIGRRNRMRVWGVERGAKHIGKSPILSGRGEGAEAHPRRKFDKEIS